MSDTSKPLEMPRPWSAPLNRPLAETVSLEVVWAAAYAAAYVRERWNTDNAVRIADDAVGDLLAARARGGA